MQGHAASAYVELSDEWTLSCMNELDKVPPAAPDVSLSDIAVRMDGNYILLKHVFQYKLR